MNVMMQISSIVGSSQVSGMEKIIVWGGSTGGKDWYNKFYFYTILWALHKESSQKAWEMPKKSS